MCQRYADIAQYGRVCKVALEAGHRKLGRQVFKQGIGHAQVAFGIFEVDRVYFVRHGR